jgi:hypothetical protein
MKIIDCIVFILQLILFLQLIQLQLILSIYITIKGLLYYYYILTIYYIYQLSAQAIFENPNYLTYSSSRGYMFDPSQAGFTLDEFPAFASNSSTLACGYNKSVRIIDG